MNKFTLIFAMLLIALVPAFAAAESFVIGKVTVNGIEVDGDKAMVEIGQDVVIVVEVKSGQNLTYPRDAKVRAEIDGYEHERIYDVSGTFTVSPSAITIRYRKALKLTLPTDMEEGIYTLYISVYDSVEKVEKQFLLYVEPTRHLLEIKGVAVSPTPYVAAGQTATVKVRLQNVGARVEDNVKVVAAIEKLGVSDVEWTDLYPVEYDDDKKSDTVTLFLPIPKDALSGKYDLEVGIAYNGGRDTQVVATKINVNGIKPKADAKEESEDSAQEPVVEERPVDPSKELTIAFDTTSQHTAVGKEVAYKLTISNLASAARDITLTSAGAQLFADIRVDPSVLTIEGGQKADVYVYAKPKSDAELKVSQFTLRVLNEGKLYKELSLSLGVEAAVAEKSNFLPFEDDTLKLVFIGLVVILIIVGLLIAFRRVKGDDYPLEPIEERIYY
ncbi:MAG: hypothetical protein QME12_01345 [Nanoarchaeota archaeon]|nr:hypothetical protein [Nanoarchaeota archaeon]